MVESMERDVPEALLKETVLNIKKQGKGDDDIGKIIENLGDITGSE